MATRKSTTKTTAKKPAAKRAPAKKPATKQLRGSSTQEERREHPPEVARSTRAPASTPTKEIEARFVAEYLIDLNGTRAYLRVCPDVTPESAGTLASRLLGKVEVQQAIAEARERTMSKLEITRERILQEAARLAFFDPRRMFRPDGSPLNITELDDDTAACIVGLEVLEEWDGRGEDRVLVGHVKRYKVADKNPAIERLFKHLGLFEKDNDQKAKPLSEALAQFVGQLHGTGVAKLRPVPLVAKPKVGP